MSSYLFMDGIQTHYTSLDWFDADKLARGIWEYGLNDTNLHVLELSVLTASLYAHRHFPREFSLTSEIVGNIMFCLLLNLATDASPLLHVLPLAECHLYLFKAPALLDLARCLSSITIIFIITMKRFSYFPLPFTWVFRDLSKFIFEPSCVSMFSKYLRKKEPSNVGNFETLMSLYLENFAEPPAEGEQILVPKSILSSIQDGNLKSSLHRLSRVSEVSTLSRQTFLDIIPMLEPSFLRFQQTRAYIGLYRRIVEFEQLCDR